MRRPPVSTISVKRSFERDDVDFERITCKTSIKSLSKELLIQFDGRSAKSAYQICMGITRELVAEVFNSAVKYGHEALVCRPTAQVCASNRSLPAILGLMVLEKDAEVPDTFHVQLISSISDTKRVGHMLFKEASGIIASQVNDDKQVLLTLQSVGNLEVRRFYMRQGMVDTGHRTRDANPCLSRVEQEQEDVRLGLEPTPYDKDNNVLSVVYNVTANQKALDRIKFGFKIKNTFLTHTDYVYDMEKQFQGTRVADVTEFFESLFIYNSR
jgi:hypothetical protein